MFWKNMKDAAVLDRLKDEALHELAMTEMTTGHRREGLWAKAIISSEGFEAKASAEYLRLLVIALRDEEYLAERADDFGNSKHREKELLRNFVEVPNSSSPDETVMANLGITFHNEHYHFLAYRYTNYADAVNYAMRTKSGR